jgi:hypothetical protein
MVGPYFQKVKEIEEMTHYFEFPSQKSNKMSITTKMFKWQLRWLPDQKKSNQNPIVIYLMSLRFSFFNFRTTTSGKKIQRL